MQGRTLPTHMHYATPYTSHRLHLQSLRRVMNIQNNTMDTRTSLQITHTLHIEKVKGEVRENTEHRTHTLRCTTEHGLDYTGSRGEEGTAVKGNTVHTHTHRRTRTHLPFCFYFVMMEYKPPFLIAYVVYFMGSDTKLHSL